MKFPDKRPVHALQVFEPISDTVSTIEATDISPKLSRRAILAYWKHGLVSPVVDPECGGYYFNEEAIRTLRRIEYLHTDCGINLIGIKKILRLMNEVERLQAEVRFLRQ